MAQAPDAFPAWLRLSEIAFMQGHFEDAQAALDHVLEPSPDDALGLVLQTRLQLARRETDKALETATRATKRHPNSPLAHHALALAQAQAGNTALALTSAKDAVARNALYADAVLLTANLEMRLGDLIGAIAGLKAYLEKQPRDPRAWELLGPGAPAQPRRERGEGGLREGGGARPREPEGALPGRSRAPGSEARAWRRGSSSSGPWSWLPATSSPWLSSRG